MEYASGPSWSGKLGGSAEEMGITQGPLFCVNGTDWDVWLPLRPSWRSGKELFKQKHASGFDALFTVPAGRPAQHFEAHVPGIHSII